MGIIIGPHWGNSNKLSIVFVSKGRSLYSDIVFDHQVYFTVAFESDRWIIRLQDELSTLLGVGYYFEKRAINSSQYTVRILATNVDTIIRLLSTAEYTQLLFHKSKVVREFVSKNYKEGVNEYYN